MSTYAASLAASLAVYAVLMLAYYGWGAALSRLLAVRLEGGERVFTRLWLGWCSSLLLFQTANFFIPVGTALSASLFVGGVVFAAIAAREEGLFFAVPRVRLAVFSLLLLVLAVWAASWSMLPPDLYDSGLYHFNTIRWINEHPVIPGLGNLHSRLAYNQSFFIYTASVNLPGLFGHGNAVANSYLLLLLMAECLWTGPFSATGTLQGPAGRALAFYLLPVLAFLAVTNSFASPTPDPAAMIMQLLLFLYFIRVVELRSDATATRSRFLALVVIAATAVTLKLSMVVYAFSLAVIALVVTLTGAGRDAGRDLPPVGRAVALASAVVLLWALRGIILSGYPLFPSPALGFPVDWAVPRERAVVEMRWIYSWARSPQLHPDNVLGSWNWLTPWLARVRDQTLTVVYPFMLAMTGVGTALLLLLLPAARRRMGKEWPLFLLPLPLAAGLLFWFFTVPDTRFAAAMFFLLPVAVLYPLVRAVPGGKGSGIVGTSAVTLVAVALLSFWFLERAPIILRIPTLPYAAVQSVPLTEQRTNSGLALLVPVAGDQCWDAPLPCTPYPDKSLRLRGKELRSGFSVN